MGGIIKLLQHDRIPPVERAPEQRQPGHSEQHHEKRKRREIARQDHEAPGAKAEWRDERGKRKCGLRDRGINRGEFRMIDAGCDDAGSAGQSPQFGRTALARRGLGRNRIRVEPVRDDRPIPEVAVVVILQHRLAGEQNEPGGEPENNDAEEDMSLTARVQSNRSADEKWQPGAKNQARDCQAAGQRKDGHLPGLDVIPELPR